jgi:hypothetical protein
VATSDFSLQISADFPWKLFISLASDFELVLREVACGWLVLLQVQAHRRTWGNLGANVLQVEDHHGFFIE